MAQSPVDGSGSTFSAQQAAFARAQLTAAIQAGILPQNFQIANTRDNVVGQFHLLSQAIAEAQQKTANGPDVQSHVSQLISQLGQNNLVSRFNAGTDQGPQYGQFDISKFHPVAVQHNQFHQRGPTPHPQPAPPGPHPVPASTGDTLPPITGPGQYHPPGPQPQPAPGHTPAAANTMPGQVNAMHPAMQALMQAIYNGLGIQQQATPQYGGGRATF